MRLELVATFANRFAVDLLLCRSETLAKARVFTDNSTTSHMNVLPPAMALLV